MATYEYKVFCVLPFAKSEFVIFIQQAVLLKFYYDPLVVETSADGISNLKRLDVFVHGKSRDDENYLCMILTISELFSCAVL